MFTKKTVASELKSLSKIVENLETLKQEQQTQVVRASNEIIVWTDKRDEALAEISHAARVQARIEELLK
jgi:hypothetical protein